MVKRQMRFLISAVLAFGFVFAMAPGLKASRKVACLMKDLFNFMKNLLPVVQVS